MSSSETKPVARAPLPPVLFFLCLLGGWAMGVAFPASLPISFRARMTAGPAILVGAAVVGLLALRAMVRSKTPFVPNSMPTSLVTSGPFRFSRNPLYVALVSTLAGVAVLLAAPWLLLGALVLAALLNFLVIPTEERVLSGAFSEQFRVYRARVRRWL